ncbi:MAG: VanW family protein [Actinomycetes bacterium]
MSPSPSRPHSGRRAVMFAGGVLAAAGVVYVGLATGGSGQVPADTVVMGHNIGDKSDVQATSYLKKQMAKVAAAPLALRVAGHKVTVRPSQLGLSFDAAATVAQATGTSWNPMLLVHRIAGGNDLDPVIRVDDAKVANVLAGLATQVDTQPVNADIEIRNGKAVLIPGEAGRQIDQKAAAQAIKDAYLHSTKPVTLPVVVVQPAITTEEATKVLENVATPALSEPVTIKAKGKKGSASGTYDMEGVLSFEPDGSTLKPVIDGLELHKMISSEFAKVEQPGRNATFTIKKHKPVLVPSSIGYGIEPAKLANAVAGVLTKSGDQRVVNAAFGPILPDRTTAQIKNIGIKQVVTSYYQHFAYAPYRVQNIGQAAKYIDGTVLMPGETFSMNDTIKERTVANGYTKGFVVGTGGVLKMDEGGGVSTATTAMYNGAWFAGLELTQHRAHSIYISRYEPGREATVAWGDFDMRFTNNTPYGILIKTEMTQESIRVTLWSTKVWDKIGSKFHERTEKVPFETLYSSDTDCHAQSGVEGFSIIVDRLFYKGGKLVNVEPHTTKYKPSPTVICGVDPNATPGGSTGGSTGGPSGSSTGGPSGGSSSGSSSTGRASGSASSTG